MSNDPAPSANEAKTRIGAIVLAAGSSTRMGRNKLLFEVGGETLVGRIVRAAVDARLEPIVVVLGHEAAAVRSALASRACRFVVNARHADGMKSSICAGIDALSLEVDAAIVLLGDMPFVTAEMLAALAVRYRTGGWLMVLSDYSGVTAPPTLIDHSLFSELIGEPVRGCSRTLRSRHADRATTLAWPVAALADVDVPSDYERLRAMTG